MKTPLDPNSSRFGRASRILKTTEFHDIKRRGQRQVLGCLIANWMLVGESAPSRLGVVTSKRVGRAIHRNRARRVIREAFRFFRPHLKRPIDLVLIARPSIRTVEFRKVLHDLEHLLKRAGLLKTDWSSNPQTNAPHFEPHQS